MSFSDEEMTYCYTDLYITVFLSDYHISVSNSQ